MLDTIGMEIIIDMKIVEKGLIVFTVQIFFTHLFVKNFLLTKEKFRKKDKKIFFSSNNKRIRNCLEIYEKMLSIFR